jgi:glyoxylase-like metal-dependent hydrolase (beta-lactamase superfamily II)
VNAGKCKFIFPITYQFIYSFKISIMKTGKDHHFIPMTSVGAGKAHELTPNLFYYTNQIVNVIMLGNANQPNWVLVDAGMPGSAKKTMKIAKERFGTDGPPQAILLTHGHFDHVGGLVDLLKVWKVPVFAHPLEFLYLSGMQDYPEPDPSVEGGLLAKLASIYPHDGIDIREVLHPLPQNGSVPNLPEWKWIHTPGHSPGHVSFFRDSDQSLIAGDAFVTVRQDSLYKVLVQKKEVNGPPRYLTTDWNAARESVKKLYELSPQRAVCGHGEAMEGEELRDGLKNLVDKFDQLALPQFGKYVPKE